METRCVTKLDSKKNTNYLIMKEAREEITRQAFLKERNELVLIFCLDFPDMLDL